MFPPFILSESGFFNRPPILQVYLPAECSVETESQELSFLFFFRRSRPFWIESMGRLAFPTRSGIAAYLDSQVSLSD